MKLVAYLALVFDMLVGVIAGVVIGVFLLVNGFGFFAYPIGAVAGVMVFLCLCEE